MPAVPPPHAIVARPGPARGRRVTRGVLLGLCLAAGLVGGVHGLARALPLPRMGPVNDKLDQFARHRDRIDIAFIGTSRTYRGVDVTEVDRRTGLRSYNLGLPGLQLFEMRALIGWLGSQRPAHLRYVIVEARGWKDGESDNRYSNRNIHFHDTPTTWYAVRHSWAAARDPSLVRAHVHAWALRTAGVGRLSGLVLVPPGAASATVPDGGHLPLDDSQPGPSARARRETFEQRQPEWHRRVAARPPFAPEGPGIAEHDVAALAELAAAVRAIGAEPAFLIPPSRDGQYRFRRAFARHLPEVHVFAFDDPHEHPDLYRPALWHDGGHLGASGAVRLSAQLGDQVRTRLLGHSAAAGPAAATNAR